MLNDDSVRHMNMRMKEVPEKYGLWDNVYDKRVIKSLDCNAQWQPNRKEQEKRSVEYIRFIFDFVPLDGKREVLKKFLNVIGWEENYWTVDKSLGTILAKGLCTSVFLCSAKKEEPLLMQSNPRYKAWPHVGLVTYSNF